MSSDQKPNPDARPFGGIADSVSKVTEIVKQVMERVRGAADKAAEPPPNYARGNTYATAQLAAAARNVRHRLIQSYRQNTNGLPLGISRQQRSAALRIEHLAACPNQRLRRGQISPLESETRIQGADTTLEVVRKNKELRSKHPKPKKLARRLVNQRVLNTRDFMAKHRERLRENKRIGRVPYVRPVAV